MIRAESMVGGEEIARTREAGLVQARIGSLGEQGSRAAGAGADGGLLRAPRFHQAGGEGNLVPSSYPLLVSNWRCLHVLHREREITWLFVSVMTYTFMEAEGRKTHR